MDNNWVVDNLQNAFTTWNTKMEELWGLLTQSPETFKGGTIWSTIVTINSGMLSRKPRLLMASIISVGIVMEAPSAPPTLPAAVATIPLHTAKIFVRKSMP